MVIVDWIAFFVFFVFCVLDASSPLVRHGTEIMGNPLLYPSTPPPPPQRITLLRVCSHRAPVIKLGHANVPNLTRGLWFEPGNRFDQKKKTFFFLSFYAVESARA